MAQFYRARDGADEPAPVRDSVGLGGGQQADGNFRIRIVKPAPDKLPRLVDHLDQRPGLDLAIGLAGHAPENPRMP